MAAIAAAEAAALAEQARRAAESARVGSSYQLVDSCNFGVQQNGYGRALEGDTGKFAYIPQIICDICLFGEAAGSRRAGRMLPCPSCKRHYHRNCLKRWASNRDLFNWASWVCGFCRFCEVCRRTGEPNKLMFCKRCDGAYHVYCQQPQLKHVPKGPFLCPRHVSCHSCGSRIPGSGSSSRWFLGYTNCDACGRLFVKGKYCPVCLKVYRDSEASPMVCCDSCEHWIHCRCDGISDEKYREFQLDHNLQYHCPACRGECHKVKDLDDATVELWRIKDDSERDLISQYQASAGIPSREKALEMWPSSDDENDNLPCRLKDTGKELVKQELPSAKLKKRNASTELIPLKKGRDKKEASESGESINKFKIILPKPGNHVYKELSSRDSRTDKNGLHEERLNQKLQMERHVKVKVLERANPVVPTIDKMSSDEGNNEDSSPSRQTISRNRSVMLAGSFSSGRVQMNAGQKGAMNQDHKDSGSNLSRTIKSLNKNRSNIQRPKLILHIPSPDKRKKQKLNANVPFVEMTENESQKDFSTEYSSGDDTGIVAQGSEQHEDAYLEERDSFSRSFQTTHHELQSNVQIYHQNPGGVRHQGWPKHYDMDDNLVNPTKILRYGVSGASKGYTFTTPRVNSDDMSAEPIGTGSVLQKHYATTGVPGRGENLGRCESFANDTTMSNDGERSIVARKVLKWNSEDKHGMQIMAKSTDLSPKVSVKLKLKKPTLDVHECASYEENDRQQDERIWGCTSKRKK